MLICDDYGRVVRIDPAWHRRLTVPERPDSDDAPYVPLQRAELRKAAATLRGLTDKRGRTRQGVGRLLTLTVLLCRPGISVGRDGQLHATQRELARRTGLSVPTINTALADLASLGWIDKADRHRGGTTHTDQMRMRVGTISNRLSGRRWTDGPPIQAPAPTGDVTGRHRATQRAGDPGQHPAADTTSDRPEDDGERTAPTLFRSHPGNVQTTPGAKGGNAVGFPEDPSGGAYVGPRAGAARDARGGSKTSRPGWQLGPSSAPTHATYTRHAVAYLDRNAPALEELLDRYRTKSDGVRVRAAVRAALRTARSTVAAHAATGILPAPAARDLVDAVARLARLADGVVRTGGDPQPAFATEDPDRAADRDSRWYTSAGTLDPLSAVKLLAARMRPYGHVARQHPTFSLTAGSWRQSVAKPSSGHENTHTVASNIGGGSGERTPDVFALIGQLTAAHTRPGRDQASGGYTPYRAP